MLPKLNGFEVLHQLRREGNATPIIILSARTGEIDKVTGPSSAPRITSPSRLAEPRGARVRAALRRAVPQTVRSHITVFGDGIDASARTVMRGGANVEMTATEFDVLMCPSSRTARCSAATRSSRACGERTTTVRRARSTTSCSRSAQSSRWTHKNPAISRPCAGWDIASSAESSYSSGAHAANSGLADLHLTSRSPLVATQDLARFVRENGGSRIVFAGDPFDTSAEGKGAHAMDALNAHAHVREALGEHVSRGGQRGSSRQPRRRDRKRRLRARDRRRALLDGQARERVRTTPWFFREGNVHIEHGHLYDPDNAPAHPLAPGATSLGVHFVESFLAPTGAYAQLLNANDGTPLKMFFSTFKMGRAARAVRHLSLLPRVVRRAARRAVRSSRAPCSAPASKRKAPSASRASPSKRVSEKRRSKSPRARGHPHAREHAPHVRALVSRSRERLVKPFSAAPPRSRSDSRVLGGAALAAGAMTMAASWAAGHDRYTGRVHEQLEDSAARRRRIRRQAGHLRAHAQRGAQHRG